MTGPLVQKLSLVVDAATGQTESRLESVGTAARNMGTDTKRAAEEVAAAAERMAQAQDRRLDAAQKVELAERKLSEASGKYAADSSQVLAAEQRLEASRRGLATATTTADAATEAHTLALREAENATRRLDEEQRRAGGGADRFGAQLGGVSTLLKGYAAFQLGDFLRDSVEGFTDGARGAQTLATSMNATVEQGGQLNQLFSNLGLEAADLLEIQAEFATKIGEGGRNLQEFGAAVQTNDDGTTNWALTLEDALVQLQKIPDATERNATGFRLFGEEGYKQLSRLLSSGVSVQDALDRIGTPFDAEDVAKAQAFDRSMADLRATAVTVGQDVGSVLVPALTTVGGGLGGLVDLAGQIPAPLGLAGVAAVGFGALSRSAATDGSFLSDTIGNIRERAGGFRDAVDNASTGTGLLARGMGTARVAGSGLLSAVGGPLGAAVIGLGVGFTVLNALTEDNAEDAQRSAQANQDLADALRESNGVTTDAVRRQAGLSLQQEGLIQTARDAGIAQGLLTDGILGNAGAYDSSLSQLEEYADALENQATLMRTTGEGTDEERAALFHKSEAVREQIDKYRELHGTTEETVEQERALGEELEQTTDKQAIATAAVEDLTRALEEGNVPTAELARLAGEAARAQDEAAAADNRAQAALDAYRATTSQATTATLELINARYASEDAGFAFLQAMDAQKAATDDGTTSVDEQRQAMVGLMEAALRAASASADAAVENAEAAGQVVDDVTEAQIRADAMLGDLRAKLNTPGLTQGARDEMQGLIDQLQAAKDRGDITAVLTLTGAPEAANQLDETTEDRETTVTVESRGGPAVISYLDGIAEDDRLALIRVESRNGPAVDSYLDGLAHERLAIIRVETRNGPAVDQYLDDLAGATRTAVIDVQTRDRPAAGRPTGTGAGLMGADSYGATISVQTLAVTVQADSAGRVTAQSAAEGGRQVVQQLTAYTRQNGPGWMKGLQR